MHNSLETAHREAEQRGGAGPSGLSKTPGKTKRGAKKPKVSPDGLLTGDRDGTEGASILVDPPSFGRTRAAVKKELKL